MSVLFIALLHAVPVFFIAAWTGRKDALVLAAVVSGCIGVATGNPSYVAADLFGVAVAFALGISFINNGVATIAFSFFSGIKFAINERRGIKPSIKPQTPAVAAKIAEITVYLSRQTPRQDQAQQPAPRASEKIEACKDYAAYKDYAYHSSLKIRVQFVQSRTPVSEVFSKEDMWAMGYIFGFADGWMQHFGISNTDQEGMFFLVCFYRDLHGAPENALNKALNSQSSSIFMQGMLVGGSDALSFKQDDTEPLALTKHLSSTVSQWLQAEGNRVHISPAPPDPPAPPPTPRAARAAPAAPAALEHQTAGKKPQQRLDSKVESVTEASTIASRFKNFGIASFWHITHKKNVPGIIRNGILNHYEAHHININSVDISDPEAQRWREDHEPCYKRKIHEYAPLYLNPRNPMLYVRKELQVDLCILEISPLVLVENQYLITDGNAASRGTQFYCSTNCLELLPWDVLRANYWLDFLDGKRKRCAEILIFPKVPSNMVKRVHCFSDATIDSLAIFGIDAHVTRSIFF